MHGRLVRRHRRSPSGERLEYFRVFTVRGVKGVSNLITAGGQAATVRRW